MQSEKENIGFDVRYWTLPNGAFHREDGPAVIWKDGEQFWYKNGGYHRLDGPAAVYSNGTKDWWINHHCITDKINQWAKEMNIDLNNLTDEDKFMIRLYWENYDGK